MRTKNIAILAITLFIAFTLVNHIGAAGKNVAISRIAKGMEDQNVQINEWSLYAKKNIGKKSINEVKQTVAQHRQYNWTFEQDDDVFKAIGEVENREKNITEKLQIITTLKNDYSGSYMLYEVKGEGTHSNWDQINDYFTDKSFDIFHENVTIFATVQGSTDDTIKGGLDLKQKSKDFLKEFQADPVEQLLEQNFISLSAQTPLWEDFIPTSNGEMNMQIALRTDGMGDKTTVVIGTPIITSEY